LSAKPQRFRGRTAEEAVLHAIEALGEDAEVVDARRVRRSGVLGLLAGEHVEVTARPRGGEAAFGRALDAAMDEPVVLDLRDTVAEHGVADPPTPPASRLPARFGDDDLAPLPAPPPGVEARATLTLAPPPPLPAGIAVAANPAVIDLRSHARNRARAASLAPPPPPPPQPPLPAAAAPSVVDLLARRDTVSVRWGRAELRAIGVPEPVLDHLPRIDPLSDALWTMALETAIWWTLRKHRPRTNLVVDGYGPEGAMALLEAVVGGHVIRYLHLGDRSVDASPRELAKAVRSCLPR
jgi:hypothetical protein